MSRQSGAPHFSEPLLPPALKNAFADFDDIAEKRFEVDLDALGIDPDRNRAAARMRFLVGVALKKDYSDGREIRNSRGMLVDYKWRIDRAKLEATPSDAWSVQLLGRAPDRQPGETGKDVAVRLWRETLLQRCYFSVVHPYLCQDPQARRKIKTILKECGLGEFADLSSPKGLLKLGAASLFGFLLTPLGELPAAAIAVTAVALCVIGLDRICNNSRLRQLGEPRRLSQGRSQAVAPRRGRRRRSADP